MNARVIYQLIPLRYSGPEKFAVVTIDVPEIGDDDVLVGASEFFPERQH